jgi:uncharacterized protein YndB with AHSA1/START domain
MGDQQVVITKIFSAPIESVFDAFVEPSKMMHWYSPENMTTPRAESDLREGGSYAVTMVYNDTPDHEETVRGVYKEIQKPNKLRFSWQWDGQDDETEVTVELRKLSNNQTELTLTHAGFEEKEYQKGFALADHQQGWNSAFNRLEVLMGGGE